MEAKKIAPGAPGIKARWTSSSKSGIGKALNTASDVSFTLSHGIVNEVYFPREDIACTRDLELLITDDNGFFSEEKRDAEHAIKMIKTGIPAYQLTNTCKEKKYEVIKEIIADPIRNTVLQKIIFKQNKTLTSPHLYALLAPHLDDEGNHNNGWTGEYRGIPMLYAQSGDLCIALASSSKWIKRSVGYVGSSDGWTDIHQHKKMEWEYTNADDGNIALTGEIDLSERKEFILSLGFGRNAMEAANLAWASIMEGFDSAKKLYLKNWQTWMKTLERVKGKNFKISSAVLRVHEAKIFPGGVIASLSIPWGETKGDKDKGGYHVVWPRDLVESAGGFMALKAQQDALRILNYLMTTQNVDGSWPQNMWLEGSPHWGGLQMDQVALPVLLTLKCYENKAIDKERMKRYWPVIKKAILFLINNGPYTQQDRWEEEKGYSPFTLAAEIAGILAGAEIAEFNNDKSLAAYCREIADSWNDRIESWTYVTGTLLAKEHEVDGYYIRINPFKNISASGLGDRTIDLKNHNNGNGRTKLTGLVSVDALSLVRFGLRAADDPKIVNTIKIIDALLKVDTPNGPCWHRYNNDGYGERENGDAYNGTGIGRAWPLLTGERAHYEIAAGKPAEAKKLLNAMDAFASNGLLSEQIWDTDDIPEKELFLGQPSGSAMPLTWAHAEYIKLCRSIKENKVFDMPTQTRKRYLEQNKTSSFLVWRFNDQIQNIPDGKNLRVQVLASAIVLWTCDAWKTNYSSKTKEIVAGIWVADIEPKKEKSKNIEFTFCWEQDKRWENENFTVEIINE